MNIQLMDCTLRDGGYVNNWNFGSDTITKVIRSLDKSNIEYIECGYLSEKKAADPDSSVFSTIEEAEKHTSASAGNGYALMLNCGEYDPDHLPEYKNGAIDILRLAFHKRQLEDAKTLCVKLKEKGYKVFFQPMVTMTYSDAELLELINWANSNMPEALYIVDSFGTMCQNDILRMYYLIDNNLDPKIKVGFHSHNNLQLSFSNAQALISVNSKRPIIIDASVFGMGRGAGNLCTELITRYINENIENKYDILPVLEIMDEYIMPVYLQHPWGYSAPYYIAAINNCHPNYATFLINKQTLCIRDINNIIKNIPDEYKHTYDTQMINALYMDHLSHSVNDSAVVDRITEMCKGRNVLLLAPGKSLSTYSREISGYISEYDPMIFSINHIPGYYRYDKIFMSNLKRFKNIEDAVNKIGDKLICTSNIAVDINADVINYSDYLTDNSIIVDNAGVMIINFLKKCGVSSFVLAGYDGFDYAASQNYFDDKMINNVASEQQLEKNSAIIDCFRKLRKTVNIKFITPSLYDQDGDADV